jgi:hypothetical protein
LSGGGESEGEIMIARLLSALIGAGVVASAFLTPPGSVLFWHNAALGALITIVAVVGMWVPRLRYVDTAAALWLFISGAILPNIDHFHVSVIAGTVLFILSLVPNEDHTFWPERHHHPVVRR